MTTFLYCVKIWLMDKYTLVISFSYTRVRSRVCTYFKRKFETLEAAEEAYNLTLSGCLEELTLVPQPSRLTGALQTSRHLQQYLSQYCSSTPNEIPCLNVPSDLKDAIFQGLAGGVSTLPQFIKKLICLSDIADIGNT